LDSGRIQEMLMRVKRLLCAVMLLAATVMARASDKTLLIQLDPRSTALPNGVSAGGTVVVGALGTGGGFYWMPTTGVIFTGGVRATRRDSIVAKGGCRAGRS